MSLYVLYVYRKPILSLTVITHVQYHCVKLIKKGEQLNSLGFMFPSSLLYLEAFLKISLDFSDITKVLHEFTLVLFI